MDWKALPGRLFNLLIVNSLHRVGDGFNIQGTVAGTIVSVYGVLIGFACWLAFLHLSLIHSALIVQLGILSYLTILNHHIHELVKEKETGFTGTILRSISTVLLVFLYLVVTDTAIGLGWFMVTVRTLFGIPNTLLWSLPGLAALLIPLIFWEPLCAATPVDEIVERAFK